MTRISAEVGGRLLALGLLAVLPGVAVADALEWLQRMNTAVRNVTYEGVAVYRTGDNLETLRVFHRNVDGQEQERMVSLSGDPREVSRANNKVTCILPEQKAVMVDKSSGLQGLLPNLSRTAFEQLSKNYELREVESKRIAGRNCQGIEIISRDAFRYSYRIWLDEETALPLSVNILDEESEILEQVVFARIDYPASLPDEVFDSSLDTSGYRRLQPADGGAVPEDAGQWEVADLPDGFRLATRDLQRLPGTDKPVLHMLFTDGLASVSVFTATEDLPAQAFTGESRLGSVNAYGRAAGDHHITVVGEVPQATVRRFGDHLRRIGAPR